MAKHKKSPHEKYTHLDYTDAYRRRKLRCKLLLATPIAALLTSVVSTSVHALSTESPAPVSLPDCKLDDDSSIDYFKAKIDDMYANNTHDTANDDALTAHTSEVGLLNVRVVDSDPAEKAADVPLRESVVDVLSDLSPRFIAASGVTRVHLEDINDTSTSGVYDYTSPHDIVLNRTIMEDFVDPNVMNAPEQPHDRTLIHDTSVHELGHAAVTNLCNTPIPPEEFSAANKLTPALYQDDIGSTYYNYVSDYAATNSSEDIAETIESIMGTPSQSGVVANLQHELEEHNLVLREKTAVVLAMLNKLEPGAGDDALTTMRMTRSQLLYRKNDTH